MLKKLTSTTIVLLITLNLSANTQINSEKFKMINSAINLGKLARKSFKTKDKEIIKQNCLGLSQGLNPTYREYFLNECYKNKK